MFVRVLATWRDKVTGLRPNRHLFFLGRVIELGNIRLSMMKTLLISIILFTKLSTASFAVDRDKCGYLFAQTPSDPLVDKALEEYSFQYVKMVSLYNGIYATIEKECPNLVDETHSVKKDVVVGHLLLNYPSNKIVKKMKFKECLLSHFYKRETYTISGSSLLYKESDYALMNLESTLDGMIPAFEKRLNQARILNLKDNLKFSNEKVCRFTFSLKEYPKNIELTELGKIVKKMEDEALKSIKYSNKVIEAHCLGGYSYC